MLKIPKIIHQIWIGPNKRPDMWLNTFAKNYIETYPEFEYILWTEKNIENLFNDFSTYKLLYDNELTWNGKSDILRYIILYKYGSIYIDADSVWVKNKNFSELIDKVNNTGVFVSTHVDSNDITGGVMGATKNNEIVLDLIKGIEKYIVRKWQNNKVCVRDYTRLRKTIGVVKMIGPIYLHKMISDKGITIFPSRYFYPVGWHGITDLNMHTKIDMPEDSFTFQYGYSTNKLENKIN